MTGDWKPDVEKIIEESDAALIDVSEMSANVKWEIETTLRNLPPQRLIFLALNNDFGPFLSFAATNDNAAQLQQVQRIGFGTGYLQQVRLRLALLRAFKNMN
jgi:hypothetical protein